MTIKQKTLEARAQSILREREFLKSFVSQLSKEQKRDIAGYWMTSEDEAKFSSFSDEEQTEKCMHSIFDNKALNDVPLKKKRPSTIALRHNEVIFRYAQVFQGITPLFKHSEFGKTLACLFVLPDGAGVYRYDEAVHDKLRSGDVEYEGPSLCRDIDNEIIVRNHY